MIQARRATWGMVRDLGGGFRGGWRGVLLMALCGVLLLEAPGFAARRRAAPTGVAHPRTPAKVAGPATPAWLVINAATGDILASQEPDRPGAPASMTKVMLALLVMEAVRDGQLKLTDVVQTSRLASKMGGSQVYLKQGESFPVEDMMAALLIGSANDAAVALAERLTGSVEATVARMNERAASLKLAQTHFGSVHGLPPSPGGEGDITTPRDMARMTQELLKFPDIVRWTSTVEAPFRGGTFILRNSNHLIGKFPGADGLKTGHFHEAGYNVTATAKRGELRLIAVVMGAPTNAARFSEAARLLGEGFSRYIEVTVVKGGAPVGAEIRLPRAKTAFRAVANSDLKVLLKREEREAIQTTVDVQPGLRAPLGKGQPVGTLTIRVADRQLARVPVVTPAEVGRTFFWWLTPWR
ncbi:MAG TPA: D-alanyl-D-alanine carboxypeptidase family protein [Candidatus Acidoferrum sp.]|nr:D-alanyl-D-alanine carboxypeptidase family protein [Candidatus Acidoferrum sp.]